MHMNFFRRRVNKFLETWSPIRLRERLKSTEEEREAHAYSVRQLIGQRARLYQLIEFAGTIAKFDDGSDFSFVADQFRRSESQFHQDILALLLVRGKRGGFFVEFGACDGIRISNTYLFEKAFGWRGILAEPGREWLSDLQRNRSCFIDARCVLGESGKKVPFYEAPANQLQSSAYADHMQIDRRSSYEVETVSLLDLLRAYDAPSFIDFISVDVEGSEFSVLEAFPFGSYKFGLMCVEHHQPDEEARIKALLEQHGYKQVFRSISEFDGWYVPNETVI